MPIDLLYWGWHHREGFVVAAVVIAVLTQLPSLVVAFETFLKTYRARTSKL